MTVSLNPATILSGQGFDVSSVVQQIIAGESGQISVWQTEGTTLSTQNGVLDGINNELTNLQTAVAALANPVGSLSAQAAISSNNSVLTATAATGAVAGTHQIEVSSLATAGTLYTNPVAAGANASILSNGQTSGSLQINVGGAGGATDTIAITQGIDDTLNTLASSINAQSAANNWGITASVVTDANGARLALQSQSTGSTGALSVAGNSNTNLTFAAPQGGTNASFTVDGVPFSSSSNTVTGAIQGVTLNLLSQDPNTTVQLSVGPDTSQITSAVNNFVTAYNTVISTINSQYVVDPTGTIPAPPLEADPSLRTLQSQLLSDVSYAIGGNNGYVNLASLGINSNNDGTLTVGANASGQSFAQIAASNPSAVQNFFQNASNSGFANNFNTDLSSLTDPTQGPLYVEVAQNTTESQDITQTINNFETQLTNEQTQLTNQFDSVNASLQAYPLLLQEVTQTLATLGSSTSSSGSTISSGPTLTSGL